MGAHGRSELGTSALFVAVIALLRLAEHLLRVSSIYSSCFAMYATLWGCLCFSYQSLLFETRHGLQLMLDTKDIKPMYVCMHDTYVTFFHFYFSIIVDFQ